MGRQKYKPGVYVEDSTRGNAKINPKTYKGDVLAQAWLDSRVLATLSVWLDSEGIMTRFLSEVIRETLEMVVDNLVRDGKIEMIDFTEDARRMLENRYRINLNPTAGDGKRRGESNIQHNLTLDSRRRKNNQVNDLDDHSGYSFTDSHLNEKENLSVPSKGDKQSNQSKFRTISNAEINEAAKKIDEEMQKDNEKNAMDRKEKILANCTYGEGVGSERVIIPNAPSDDIPRGPIYEDEFKAYKEEERKREEREKNEKEIERIKRRIEKKKNKLDDIKENSNE